MSSPASSPCGDDAITADCARLVQIFCEEGDLTWPKHVRASLAETIEAVILKVTDDVRTAYQRLVAEAREWKRRCASLAQAIRDKYPEVVPTAPGGLTHGDLAAYCAAHDFDREIALATDDLRGERDKLRTAGVCEIAAVDPSVASYCREWEARTDKAERERDAALALLTKVGSLRPDVQWTDRLKRELVADATKLLVAPDATRKTKGGSDGAS